MLRWSADVRGEDSGQGRTILLRFGCIIILAKECKCTRNAKLTLLSTINHYNRSKSDASSSLPDAYSMIWYLWCQCSDEAPACVEETVAREERFCFVLVVLQYLPKNAYAPKKQNCLFCRVFTITIEANPMQVHRCQMLIQCYGTSGTNAPMKRRRAWRRQWPGKSDFASFWLYYNTCQRTQMHKKMQNWLFCQVLTITIEANPMQVHRCQMLIQCSGTYDTNAPMKRRRAWRRQWPGKSDFASFWLYNNTCQRMQMHQKCKIDFFVKY